MRIESTDLPQIHLLASDVHRDDRGFFSEVYNRRELSEHGIDFQCVQVNHSFSKRAGTIRGLHFQVAPAVSGKIVRVLHGAIFDVAVDIRRSSTTFGKYTFVELDARSLESLYVAPGFAHGFCTLEDETHVEYLTDAHWSPDVDKGVRWNDPDIGVPWPVDREPILSVKDQELPFLAEVGTYEWTRT